MPGDPRRKLDEKWARIERAHIPVFETSREVVYEERALGSPAEKHLLVIRIDTRALRRNLLFFLATALCVAAGFVLRN